MSLAARRCCLAALLMAASLAVVSCGTFKMLDQGPSAIRDSLEPGDRVRVILVGGELVTDVVVRVEESALVCQGGALPWDQVASVERWEKGSAGGYVLFFLGTLALTTLMMLLTDEPFSVY